VAQRVSDRRVQWRVVERVAALACRQGGVDIGVRLYAAAERGRAALHDLVDPAEHDLRMRDRAAARDALGEQAYADAARAGKDCALEEAAELARGVIGSSPGVAHVSSGDE
jgi:hypothetical protein